MIGAGEKEWSPQGYAGHCLQLPPRLKLGLPITAAGSRVRPIASEPKSPNRFFADSVAGFHTSDKNAVQA
jgi:hypothetical protein